MPGAALAAAVVLSALGMAFHTVREFDWAGLVDPASGFIPVAGIQLGLLAWWSLAPGSRRAAARWLMFTGWFQLIGGAIISVLPLPILPFVPAQTIEHYVSHLILGLCQLPLIVVPRRMLVAATAGRYP